MGIMTFLLKLIDMLSYINSIFNFEQNSPYIWNKNLLKKIISAIICQILFANIL